MSVLTQRNVATVLVGKDNTQISTATVQITDSTVSGTYIADGQLLVLDSSDNILTPGKTVSDSPYIRFVAREGATASTAKLNYSARMRGVDLVSATYKAFSAATEQVSSIGFNGSTGSIDNTSNDYVLTVVNDWDDMQWSKQKDRKAYDYSDTTPTQLEIAKSFSAQVNFNGFRSNLNGVPPWISATMLSDSTTANATTGTPTITVVNGSDIVTFSNAVSTNGVTVGDHLRLGSAAATATTAVYVVTQTPTTDTSLSSTQVRVHTYFQGTTISAGAEGASWDRITAGTNYGVKFTGLPLTFGIPPYSDFKFKKASFHLDLTGFGTTTKSDPSTTPTKGNGEGEEVQEWEYFAMGNEGALNRTVIPLPTGRTAASASSNYDTFSLVSRDRSKSSPITAVVPMEVQTFLFTINGGTNTATILANLRAQLNPYLNSVGIASV